MRCCRNGRCRVNDTVDRETMPTNIASFVSFTASEPTNHHAVLNPGFSNVAPV
ncbi:hypothetical protein BJX99DRAFT_218549 [Aspergillus californicus]